jgi:sugar phosphate isomerase/epimerase
MKLGFLTACLPDRPLDRIASWAAENGFEALEVAAWPRLGNRPFTASHIDVENFDADKVRTLFDRHGLALTSLAFYDNNLHPTPTSGRRSTSTCWPASTPPPLLGVPTVGTFVGRDPTKPVAENLARRRRCSPAGGPRGGARREDRHRELRDGGLAPRRLPGQPRLLAGAVGVDVLPRAVPQLRPVPPGVDGHRPGRGPAPYVDRVAHAQAKDIEVFPERRNRYGWPGRRWSGPTRGTSAGGATGCRVSGQVDWTRVVDTLYEGGFDGVLSVEHEDPSGAAPRSASRPACASRTAPCDR